MLKTVWSPLVRVVLAVLVSGIALGVGFFGYIFLTLDPNQWRLPLEQALSQSSGRQVEVGRLRFSTVNGLGIRADQIAIRDRSLLEGQGRDLLLEIELLPLLWQQVAVRKLTIDRLNLKVRRDRRGVWSIADLLSRPVETERLSFDPASTVLQLTRATVSITDELITPSRSYQLVGLDLRLGGSRTATDPLPISMQGTLDELGQQTVMALEGKILAPATPDQNWQGDLQMLVSDFQPQNWEGYWRAWLVEQGLTGLTGLGAGRLDLDLRWQGGTDGATQLTGRLGAKALFWQWPQVFGPEPWFTPSLVAQLDLKRAAMGEWQANPVVLNLGEMAVTLTGSFDPAPQRLSLQATSNDFDPYLVRDRLPLNLIPKPLVPWLVTSTGKGKLKFSGQTQGTLNQLTTTGQVDLLGLGLKTATMDGDIDSLTGQLVFDPNQVEFKQVKLGLGKSACAVNGTLRDNQWDLKVDAPNLDLGRLSGISSAFFRQFVGEWRGQGRLLGQLQGPLGNPAFVGSLELLQAEFRDRRLPRPVTQLAGSLRFEPGLLTLDNLQGKTGGGAISLTGTVTQPGQSNASPDLTLKGNLDLALVQALLNSPLVGRALQTSRLTRLNGTAQGTLNFQGSSLNGELDLRDVTVGLTSLGLPLTQVQGMALLSGGDLELRDLRGFAGPSNFTFNGLVRNFLGRTALNGSLRGQLVFPSARQLLPELTGTLQAVGSAPFNVTFTSQGDSTLAQGDGDLSGIAQTRLGELNLGELEQGTFTALATPDRLALQQATLVTARNTLQLVGTVRRWSTPAAQVRLSLTSDPQPLTQLTTLLPWLADLDLVQGQGQLDLQLSGTRQASNWVGGVRLNDVQIPILGGLAVNGNLSLAGKGLRANNLKVLWRDQLLTLSGTYTPGIPTVTFQAQADQLDLDKLLNDYLAAAPLRSWQGSGTLNVRTTQLGSLPVQGLQTTLVLGENLRLEALQATTSQGRLRGNLTLETTTPPSYSGEWTFAEVQLGRLTNSLLSWGDESLGVGTVQVTFKGQGATAKQFIGSLTGQGELKAQSPFKWLAPLAKSTGLAINNPVQYALPFTLEAGQAKFPPSVFSSTAAPDPWQAELGGQVNLTTGQAETGGTLRYLSQTFRLRLKGGLTDSNPNAVQEAQLQEN